MSVSIARSPKCSGWFPVGPRCDSIVRQQEITTQISSKCWFNLSRLISYTGLPAVVGRSEWMRRWHTNTPSHTTNLALQTFHSVCSLVFPHAVFVLLLHSSPLMCCCLHAPCVCICVGVYERLHKLYHACVTLLCVQVCMWFLALLQAHWRLSSHQDVPTGPSLGRVPGLSPACVLAECRQIIRHTWKVAWRWSYPPFTPNPCLPQPSLSSWPKRPEIAPEIPAAYPWYTPTPAFTSSASCVQH